MAHFGESSELSKANNSDNQMILECTREAVGGSMCACLLLQISGSLVD